MAALTGANALPPIAALITAPILSHSLGVVSRGEVAAASAPYLLATAVATFGIPEAVTHFVARGVIGPRMALRRGLPLVLLLGALATLGLAAGSNWLAAGDPRLRRLILLGAASIIPSLALGVVRGLASGLQCWSLVVRERLVATVVRLLLIVVLALASALTTATATLTIVLTPLIGLLVYLPIRRSLEGARAGSVPLRRLMSYGLHGWVGSISGIVLLRIDQALMNPLAGARELGLYTVAATVSEIPLITTAAIRDVTFVADSVKAENERLATTSRVCALLAGAIGLAIAVTVPFWIELVFGKGFDPAVGVTWLLLLAVVAGAPGSIIAAGLSGRGRPDLRSAALVVASVVNVGAIIALVPSHGARGAAVATLLGNSTAGLVAALMFRRTFGVALTPFYGVRRGDLRLILDVGRRLSERGMGRRALAQVEEL